MRPDILQDKKCVHIKLSKDVHASLRSKLFHHNLSMQELFDEFARLVVAEDAKATKIIEQLVMRKVKEAIEGNNSKKKKEENINELDHNVLYDLIQKDVF